MLGATPNKGTSCSVTVANITLLFGMLLKYPKNMSPPPLLINSADNFLPFIPSNGIGQERTN